MSYVDGFVLAVPEVNREAYRQHAAEAVALFHECGVTRMVEAWGDDVPDGKLTDFRGAVQAEPGEVVVFSWMEYPSREVRDEAMARMMADPRMTQMVETMPFDGRRMIFGGFAPLLDEGAGGAAGYVDGVLVPVPEAGRGEYLDFARKSAAMFLEYGALRMVETWGDDLQDGTRTDFRRAVKAVEGEQVVFSWLEWPSKEARDAGWQKVMADPRMGDAAAMPFDGSRMVYGGFAPLFDA